MNRYILNLHRYLAAPFLLSPPSLMLKVSFLKQSVSKVRENDYFKHLTLACSTFPPLLRDNLGLFVALKSLPSMLVHANLLFRLICSPLCPPLSNEDSACVVSNKALARQQPSSKDTLDPKDQDLKPGDEVEVGAWYIQDYPRDHDCQEYCHDEMFPKGFSPFLFTLRPIATVLTGPKGMQAEVGEEK
jgi:hypothetical protein